jgi:predicted ATP-binding protein involved in virulence
MKIKEIEIKNFRGIDNAKFELSNNLNVFVGVNGSGKTTVLDAIVTSLSWLVNRIQRENSSGRPITDSSIKNDASFSSIDISVSELQNNLRWKLTKTAKGEVNTEKSDLVQVSELAAYFQSKYRDNSILPVFAYYPINRVVNAISPDYSGKNSINILDVYDNALDGKTNYQSFFEWFRLQDDIVNEQSQSRIKWMVKNRTWIKNRTKRLLQHLEEMNLNKGPRFIEYKKESSFLLERNSFLFEEPRYLFRELTDLLHFSTLKYDNNREFERVFRDLEYMLHEMSMISNSRKDSLIEFDNFPTSGVKRIIERITELQDRKNFDENEKTIITFIWEALLLAVLLGLWWLSDKGKKEIERIFAQFNPVKYKDKWIKVPYDFYNEFKKIVANDAQRLDKATRNEGRELQFVTTTIENFVPSYSNFRIKRVPRPQMVVDKEGIEINLDQLSDGEKNLIALVGDISRRLSIANPLSKKPLDGEGVILIDEIDLHLHPSWQRLMIPQLQKAFPNCQFIITTHSPQVLSHVHRENIFLLKNDKDGFTYSKASESFGQNSDRILEDLLGVDARPTEQKNMLHEIFLSIQNGELEVAKDKVRKLSIQIGEDPEIIKANVLIKRKEILGK